MAIQMGALELLIQDRGADAVLKTLARIDTAAAKIGSKPVSITISLNAGSAVVQELAKISSTTAQVVAAMGSLTTAVAGTGLAILDAAEGMERSGRGAERLAAGGQKASSATKTLNKEIAETNKLLSMQARAIDPSDKKMVDQFRSAAAAQGQWLQQVKASDVQQLQFARTVQQFEQRVTRADAAQAKAAASTRILGQEVVKADGQLGAFGKRGLSTLNATAFAFSQLAAEGQLSLQSLTSSVSGALAFLGPKGAIASIGLTVASAAGSTIGGMINADREARKLDLQSQAKAELTIAKARQDAEAALNKAAFDQGKAGLQNYFKERQRIINDQAQSELEALQKFVIAANTRMLRIPIGRDKERDAAKREVDELNAKIQAVELQRQGQTAALTAERTAAERNLERQVLDFEARRMEAQGQTHEARMLQIQQEVDAFRRLPLRPGESAESRSKTAGEVEGVLTRQAALQNRLLQFQLKQQELDTDRALIMKDLATGVLTQEEATKRVAALERDRKQALRDSLAAALGLAIALGDPAALANIRALAVAVEQLGIASIDITTDPITKRFQTQVEQIQKAVASGALSEERGRQLVREAGFASGLAGGISDALANAAAAGMRGESFLQSLGQSFSQMTGNILVQVASDWIKASTLMAVVQKWFVANPIAAVGAAVALMAFGRVLGGSGGGGGGASSTFSAPNQDIVKHIWLDPDRREITGPATAAMPRSPIPSSPPPMSQPMMIQVNQTFLGENDPQVHGWISRQTVAAARAGYRIG